MKRWPLLIAAAAACSSRKEARPEPPPVLADAAVVVADVTPTDPQLARLADAALGCPWDDARGFSAGCPEVKAWLTYRGPNGLDEAAMVAMLEHGDEKHRHLGALQLEENGKAYRTDRALATRMLAVAKDERSSATVYDLSDALARIDLAATGGADAVRALVAHHESHIMRGHLVAGLLVANPRSDEALAITRGAFTDSHWVVRTYALDGLIDSGVDPAEACTRTLEAIAGDDAGVADTALIAIRNGKACRGRATQIIEALTQRMDAGKLRWTPNAGVLLQAACQDGATSADDRARAAALGRRFVAKEDDLADFRAAGLHALFACDPAGGRELARSLRRDPDLGAAAKAILETPP